MEFNFAYNKPNSFFKDKKARVINPIYNLNNEKIDSDSIVTISKKSNGLKVFFDIHLDSKIYMYNVSFEDLELTK